MKCQSCPAPATVHLTDIVQGKKKELHLCQSCAEQHNVLTHDGLNLPGILQALIGQHVGQLTDELARLACPACGLRFMEFRADGRLGCPHDYHVFRTGLGPLLERIHRAGRHVGKRPKRPLPGREQVTEVLRLRRRLQTAVDDEDYAAAARYRDLLRQKEAADESG